MGHWGLKNTVSGSRGGLWQLAGDGSHSRMWPASGVFFGNYDMYIWTVKESSTKLYQFSVSNDKSLKIHWLISLGIWSNTSTLAFCLTELRRSVSSDVSHNAGTVNLRWVRFRVGENKSMSYDTLNLLMPDFSGTTLSLGNYASQSNTMRA